MTNTGRTQGEVAIGMVAIGAGIYLTPSDASMTREQMAAWFRIRGVADDAAYLDELLTEHAGRTEADMDAIYEKMHP